jgi:hypothetical protein
MKILEMRTFNKKKKNAAGYNHNCKFTYINSWVIPVRTTHKRSATPLS